MKLLFTVLLHILLVLPLSAQERTISGRLTSTEDGSPLAGFSIVIKGTDIGTTTDADGYYSIRVPIGSILVYSFVGMQTREVLVTETNLQPIGASPRQGRRRGKRDNIPQKIPPSLYEDSTAENIVGVAVLTDETPTYNVNGSTLDPTTIKDIKPQGRSYTIKRYDDATRRTGVSLQFTTSIGIEQINKLPSFQNEYAQGRTDGTSLQWRGADQGEIFSWGPLLRTLEFDGSNYSFDNNGRLVGSGTGTGMQSRRYNALSFFRSGFSNANELMVMLPTARNGTLVFDLENRTRSGIIPYSQYHKINFSTGLKDLQLTDKLTLNASVFLNRSAGDLLSRGSNLATIVGAVYRTPVTFDNADGLSSSSARSSSLPFEFSDGQKRSHAPGAADNPYGLAQELPDNEKLSRVIATSNLTYSGAGPFSVVLNASVDRQSNTTAFGIPPGYSGHVAGRATQRMDDETLASGILTTTYSYFQNNSDLKLSLAYMASYTNRQLTRHDGFGFDATEAVSDVGEADSIVMLSKDLMRSSHELIIDTRYAYASWLNVRLTNRNYFSNTISNDHYVNLFPSGSVSVDLADLLYLGGIDELKFYGSISRTIREASLLYSGWAYSSTQLNVEDYARFYEASELFLPSNILPETERMFETGLKFWSGRVNVDMNYFNNVTRDFIAPVLLQDDASLVNAATVKNYGGNISAGYLGYLYNGRWRTDLKWTKYNSVVQELNTSNAWIPLAGFETIQTALAPGEPVGAIYGTTYLRDAAGNVIIGDDGFPVENDQLTMIGNSIPDWTLGWSSSVEWKQLKLSFLIDFKKGGDVWNGTNSILDYLGRSANSGKNRNTANHVFDGVDVDGNPNVIGVDFYDPQNPMAENRWVRYGWDGVGEDYVEDASWVRLNELAISYSSKYRGNDALVKHISVSLTGRNLFLVTPYSGVDPTATLFGYTSGNGLDLFNVPSTRSYDLKVTVKI